MTGVTDVPLQTKSPTIQITKWRAGYQVINVWDFAGEETLHDSLNIFLSKNCIYVIVMDGQEANEDANLEHWLYEIQPRGSINPPCLCEQK